MQVGQEDSDKAKIGDRRQNFELLLFVHNISCERKLAQNRGNAVSYERRIPLPA